MAFGAESSESSNYRIPVRFLTPSRRRRAIIAELEKYATEHRGLRVPSYADLIERARDFIRQEFEGDYNEKFAAIVALEKEAMLAKRRSFSRFENRPPKKRRDRDDDDGDDEDNRRRKQHRRKRKSDKRTTHNHSSNNNLFSGLRDLFCPK